MKKTLVAALASLMLAGALCAVDGAPAVNSGGQVAVAADGCAPLVISESATADDSGSRIHPLLNTFLSTNEGDNR